MSHHFVWYELNTTAPAAAPAFYAAVAQWGLQKFEHGDYQMWTTARGPIGGLMLLPEEAKAMGAPPHWMGYVGVENVDETAARVTSLGGKIYVPPKTIAGAGRFAVFADPQGAAFSVHSFEQPMPRKEPGDGDFCWSELISSNPAGSFAFYSELFGWTKLEAMDMGAMGLYQTFGPGGTADRKAALGGIMGLVPGVPVSMWLYYINVPHLDAALGAVRAHGGKVVSGPNPIPGNARIATCLDPQGAAFALHSMG